MSKSGTYIVVLKNKQVKTRQIGKLAKLLIQKGYYVYIGSAFGPGGVVSRINHHSKISKKPHWHLDYLSAETEFYEAYAEYSSEKKECEWASFISKSEMVSEPLKGFGSSDCRCSTHLFYFTSYVKMASVIQGISGTQKVGVDALL